LAYDNDALKDALKYCEIMLNYGKEVYLVNIKEKDPNKMGFKNFIKFIENVKPMKTSDLIKYKINIIYE